MDGTKSNRREKRRIGIERRQFSYTHHYPERRDGKDRRRDDNISHGSENKK